MARKYDPNALWVALSEYTEGNVFEVYPKLLAQLFLQEEAARQGDFSEAEKLVLPSDKEWRLTQYFYLVDLQKKALKEEDGKESLPKTEEDSLEEWAPWSLVIPTKNPHAPPPVALKTTPGPAWDINQVVKAARLLFRPTMPCEFVDEQEMRFVYSLIYDVFRYKTILEQAIEDIKFIGDYPQFMEHRQCIWLFLMELARRQWGARPRGEMELANQLLEEAGSPIKDIENTVWKERVHFAAAIARIRIKNGAFMLADLLPAHLREERMMACVHKETVTGWVNTFKAKKVALLIKRLHELGYTYSNSRQLCAGEYKFDRVCPRFITLRPPPNVSIGQMDLVKDGVIVLQEREFCEGASTLCRALRANSLSGVVAQTHASSPRCSAYLAAQLKELGAYLKSKSPALPATPQIGKLVVFGAGDKVNNYVNALRELGIDASDAIQPDSSVCVLSEAIYCESPTVNNALEGVVAVLATPPNSYSAVTDPIDLVCGRGGDITMLEVLTESEVDTTSKTRVQTILEEQKKTLRTLMSKPQIQLILYETHSALEAENQAQVTRAVSEANRLARERHMWIKKKHRTSSPKKQGMDITVTDSASSLANTVSQSDVGKDDVDMSPHETPAHSPERRSQTNSRPTSSTSKKTKPRPQSGEILKKETEVSETNSRPPTNRARPIPSMSAIDGSGIPSNPDDDSPHVFVPKSDLFEVKALPNLGNGLDINYILDRDGCYLGLIQRKEIVRLDAKYMISVAEERGLFGPAAHAPQPARRKIPATASPRRRKRKNSFEVERVAAPTYASLSRQRRRGSAPAGLRDAPSAQHVCERHARRQAAAAGAGACSCDARHRARRASEETGVSPRAPGPPCRRPFPVVIQDLRLRAFPRSHPTAA